MVANYAAPGKSTPTAESGRLFRPRTPRLRRQQGRVEPGGGAGGGFRGLVLFGSVGLAALVAGCALPTYRMAQLVSGGREAITVLHGRTRDFVLYQVQNKPFGYPDYPSSIVTSIGSKKKYFFKSSYLFSCFSAIVFRRRPPPLRGRLLLPLLPVRRLPLLPDLLGSPILLDSIAGKSHMGVRTKKNRHHRGAFLSRVL